MRQIIKANNNELSLRLKLNYNNVYSRLKMMLGKSGNLFADLKTMSATTSWYADDDADYTPLSEAPKGEMREIMVRLNSELKKAKKEIEKSRELAPFSDDILEVPDNSYVFYRKLDDGSYKFVLAGWGFKQAHTGLSEGGGLIRRVMKTLGDDEPEKPGDKTKGGDPEDGNFGPDIDISDDAADDDNAKEEASGGDGPDTGGGSKKGTPKKEKVTETDTDTGTDEEEETGPVKPKQKKLQKVTVKVLNQNMKPVEDEDVRIRTNAGEVTGITDENGLVEVGNLPYHSSFSVSFPNMPTIQERAYEVEPKVEQYDVHIKKYINYSPVLFVEDQNGTAVVDYNIKVVIGGHETVLNTGTTGMVQLPTMQEGQKFIVIDAANYANSEEYAVTSDTVKKPFRFAIRRAVKTKVGITVLDKQSKPIEGVTVDIIAGENPYQQVTDSAGRTEFPSEIFTPGETGVKLYVPGKGKISSKLKYEPETSEYTIQLTGKKPGPVFNWKWLLLLPLLLLLGVGAKWLYDYLHQPKVPTIAEMEKGVCMIYGQGFYYVDLKVPGMEIDNHKPIFYFNYDENKRQILNGTFDPNEAKVLGWTGTGFLISEDGLIATNKHVAAPEPPEEAAIILKRHFQEQKDKYQRDASEINAHLAMLGGRNESNHKEYDELLGASLYCQEQVRNFDNLINTGDFTVKVVAQTRVAFTDSRVDDFEDFIPCSKPRAVGSPGGVKEKDLAIIQIKKKQDIPADAYVFNVPEEDLMDGEIPDNYGVTVLGYNKGDGLQDMNFQDGLKPQAQHGKITNRSEKYRVGYDAPTIEGSSGAPVINDKGELVAINNSGLGNTQGFNYGIRTKYLRELLDELQKGKGKKAPESKDDTEKRHKTK